MARRTTALLALAGVLVAVGLYTGRGVLTGLGAGRGDDCVLTELEDDGAPVSVRVECEWPIPVERLQALLESSEAQARYFSHLGESTVLGTKGDSVIVRQLHRATGISDREVVVEWDATPFEDGWRYSWRKSPDQSAATGRGVEVEDYEGSWELTPTETGSHIALETRYAPGGRVPFFLVRSFQGSGIQQVMRELRTAAESEVQVASGPES
jgi:hypothetical protein